MVLVLVHENKLVYSTVLFCASKVFLVEFAVLCLGVCGFCFGLTLRLRTGVWYGAGCRVMN